jgi:hypothetical protein
MSEMPQERKLRGTARVGNARIRSLDDETMEITLDDDGLFKDEKISSEGDFHENLAEYLYTGDRKIIARDLIEFFEIDKESRADWEERVSTALHMLGIKKMPSENLPFPDAANVIHPGIATACVQFQARAIEEFFPPAGPVKAIVIGAATRERQQQADRVENFMNWYYTDGDKGYFPDTDQLLFKLPVYGSVFRKSYPDPRNGRPMQRHVNGWDFIAPYNGQDLESMSRYCHRYYMNGNDVRRSIARGFFRDIDLPKGNITVRLGLQEEDRPDDAADDRTPSMHEKDDVYEILEYHLDYELPNQLDAEYADFALPYIVFVERSTQEVLRIERNWREEDPECEKRVWFTHYRYLPGLGFYGFGLLHIIGSLGEAATGAVKALLDAAARNALSGGFKSKDLKIGGDVVLEPGMWKDVDASPEELEKGFYTPPVPTGLEPLFNMLEILTTGMDRFSVTTEAMVGDAPTNGPVGTMLAMIEQGSKLISGIHKRTHASARHEFSLFCELVSDFSPYEQYPYAVEGEDRIVFRADFDERVDVLPVSDPNIWSSTQRIALSQATLQIVTSDPETFGKEQRHEAYRRMFEALKVPQIDSLLPEEQVEPYLDPVSENMRMMTGQHVKAWPHQEHEAHLAVHENWLAIQQATLAPEVLQILLPQGMAHIQEHKAYLYQQQVMQALGLPLPIMDVSGKPEEPMPPELEAALARATAQALLPVPDPEADAETQAAMSEEQRKDMAATREQERKDMASAREEERKDLKAMLEARRTASKGALELHSAARESSQRLDSTGRESAQRLRLEGLGFVQKLGFEREMGNIRLQEKRKQAQIAKAKPKAKST